MKDISLLKKKYGQILVITIVAAVVYMISSSFDFLEKIVAFSRLHEEMEIDEIITVLIYLTFAFGWISTQKSRQLARREKTLLVKNKELEEAFGKIKQLEGVLPICANCKKIRDDKGKWQQMESYIHKHSEASFSHGMCPECEKDFYEDFNSQI